VIALPGLRPKSPEMTEGPVLVTVVPANTAKGAAVPKLTGDWDAEAADIQPAPPTITITAVIPSARTGAVQRPKSFERDIRITVATSSCNEGRS
jgi:hypothetical protein